MAAKGDAAALIHLLNGNALMIPLAAKSVHMCVTSPPYWSLRDYGLATWEGGDPGCDHRESNNDNKGNSTESHVLRFPTCPKCGAIRHDAGLGLESTIDEYVANMVAAFREVKRVLRDDGTVWLNLGDSYCSTAPGTRVNAGDMSGKHVNKDDYYRPETPPGLKPKDLCGIPWSVAFALQADGWYLRSDIIWAKPNPMPESVTDRPTKSHEYLFLLSKRAKYAYDADAVREEHSPNSHGSPNINPGSKADAEGFTTNGQGKTTLGYWTKESAAGRNRRTVWSIATQPYSGSHFATFPEALVEPCIKAGASEAGCCPECGAQFERVTERGDVVPDAPGYKPRGNNYTKDGIGSGMWAAGSPKPMPNHHYEYTTTGFSPTCSHKHDPIPCTVFDPFAGSGTVGLVARRLGRHFVGVDLSAEYLQLARKRLELDRLDEWKNGVKVEDETYEDLPLFAGVFCNAIRSR